MGFFTDIGKFFLGKPKRRGHVKRRRKARIWKVFIHDERGIRKHPSPVKASTKSAAMLKAKRIAKTFGGATWSRVTVK